MQSERSPKGDYAVLAENVERAAALMRSESIRAFRRLREIDSELAEQAIETCGTEASAAAFLARERKDFAGESAYGMLASGQRDRVLDVLRAIYHGVYL